LPPLRPLPLPAGGILQRGTRSHLPDGGFHEQQSRSPDQQVCPPQLSSCIDSYCHPTIRSRPALPSHWPPPPPRPRAAPSSPYSPLVRIFSSTCGSTLRATIGWMDTGLSPAICLKLAS